MKCHGRDLRGFKQRHIAQRARQYTATDFFNVLTGAELLDVTEAHLPEHRERLYPPTVTLSMFMSQALNADRSCQRAVNAWAVQRAAEGLSESGLGTGSYCKARQRLPLELIAALTRHTGRELSERARSAWRWRNRAVKLIDGTTVWMPDTTENQERYPQPAAQVRGLGFPIARIVGVICLSTGAVLDAAMGPYKGLGGDEHTLARRLIDHFHPGDIVLADALYTSYFWVCALRARGVDLVAERHGARTPSSRWSASRLRCDHPVRWYKPTTCPAWMSMEQYRSYPKSLMLREVTVQGRTLITTLCDAHTTHKSELGSLYRLRWNIELDLRNIKTTLQMDRLSCHSPQMNEKEMWVHLLAYNLIRLLMAQAATHAGVSPRQLSFKHTVQLWNQWQLQPLRGCRVQDCSRLFRLVAAVRVGNRPGRIEPRALKRRPKCYDLLTEPRALARVRVRIHGHQWV